MEVISLRVSAEEAKMLKKEALKNGVKLSVFLRDRLFQKTEIEDFDLFKQEYTETNLQLIELLKTIHTQARIGTNITAKMYTTAFPDVARAEIKKVKNKFLGDENND